MRLVRRSRWLLGVLTWVAVFGSGRDGAAQSVDAELGTQVFYEPSFFSDMLVITPRLSLSALPSESFRVNAGYTADIVSGASESIKAGPLLASQPDIVSQASVVDTRHVANVGIAALREHASLEVGYSYGFENDYRSHAISVSGTTDFFQRNTELTVAYAHGIDSVCNLRQLGLAATLRQRLDSSTGCFSDDPRVISDSISLDNVQLSWTQSWTPVLITQLALTGSVQHGFLGNPYRDVVIGPTGQTAQEHHPENRARGAATLKLKYYVKGLQTMFGGGVRGYADSWDVISQAYELEAERYVLPWLRVRVHGRYYAQSEALFWSDDYTGGEPLYGARGQYWSGDRELSPLKNILIGGRLVGNWRSDQQGRIMGLLLSFSAGFSVDVIKTYLDDFTWAGRDPDDTLALVPSLSLGGTF
ncbi:MAG TPA: DUF3570 domain-containing protein [Polyangiaceae bacterium]|nr:DUF3570 domain-containing protein [Polyangiaceae bacterium]